MNSEIGYVSPVGDYLTPRALPSPREKLHVSISKCDNGYVLDLYEPFQPVPMEPMEPITPEIVEEKIDTMIDGISGLIQHLNDRGAGEDWKGSENREKLREAFKLMFPQIYRQIQAPPHPPMPRMEQRVFESKDELVKYLEKNL